MTEKDLLRTAAFAAARRSHDPRTQNGAVLVPSGGWMPVAVAANHYPVRWWAAGSRLEAPEKYRYIEHAERAVIYKAAACGQATEGSTLYCPWFACTDCARAIICAGVAAVVGHEAARARTPSRWAGEVAAAESMLTDAGVAMRWLGGTLGVSILFDGEKLEL
jgi:dCMP deaminase